MSGSPPASAPAKPRPGIRRWALEIAILVVPLALLIVALLVVRGGRVPSLDRAVEMLRARIEPTDLVLVAGVPPQDAVRALHDLPFILLPRRGRIPTAGFDHIWLLDARRNRVRPAPPGLPAPEESHRLPGLVLSRYSPLRRSLARLLPGAEVRFLPRQPPGAPPVSCPARPRGFFHCAVRPWARVRVGTLRVRGAEHRCVLVHPIPEGTLAIRFPAVRLGRRLTLRTALADSAGPVPPVEVQVRIDGRTVARFRHRASPGWESHPVDTRRLAGRAHRVELLFGVAQAAKHHFCFSGGS